MKQLIQKMNQSRIYQVVKPWLAIVGVFLILRYSGIIGGISFVANSALMKTGALDASAKVTTATNFDYNFSVKDMDGKVIPFSQFKGKTVFLNVWATWCGPCRYEMPSIESLYQKVDKNKVVFVMLSVDKPEHTEKIKKFVADNQYSFPVFQLEGYLPETLEINSIPTTFVISADGKLLTKKVGTANYDTPKYKQFLEEGK